MIQCEILKCEIALALASWPHDAIAHKRVLGQSYEGEGYSIDANSRSRLRRMCRRDAAVQRLQSLCARASLARVCAGFCRHRDPSCLRESRRGQRASRAKTLPRLLPCTSACLGDLQHHRRRTTLGTRDTTRYATPAVLPYNYHALRCMQCV